MKRHELLERLAPLIPPPRAHQVRYHGVLAPCASGRDRVVPCPAKARSPSLLLAKQGGDQGAIASRGRAEGSEPLGAQREQPSSPPAETARALVTQLEPGRAATVAGESVGVSLGRAAPASLRGGRPSLPELR
jgi:hypothetical protein